MGAENLKRIDFPRATCDSDGRQIGKACEMTVLFNDTVISPDEVKRLITEDMAGRDMRCVLMPKEQADLLCKGRQVLPGCDGKGSMDSNYEKYAKRKQPEALEDSVSLGSCISKIKELKGKWSDDVLDDIMIFTALMFDRTPGEIGDAVSGKTCWIL